MAIKPMTMSGFCQWPSSIADSHVLCTLDSCTCDCHPDKAPVVVEEQVAEKDEKKETK